MADAHDRFDNRSCSCGSFVMGLLTGTALGAGLGLLFAPKAGSKLRKQLSTQADALGKQAQEGYREATETADRWVEKGKETAGEWAEKSRETAGEWAEKGKEAAGELAERGKDIYSKAVEAVSLGAEEAQKYVRDAASTVTGTGHKSRRS